MIKTHIKEWNEQKSLGFPTLMISSMWTEEAQEIIDTLKNMNEHEVLYATSSTNTASHLYALQKAGATIKEAVQFDNKYFRDFDEDNNRKPVLKEAILLTF